MTKVKKRPKAMDCNGACPQVHANSCLHCCRKRKTSSSMASVSHSPSCRACADRVAQAWHLKVLRGVLQNFLGFHRKRAQPVHAGLQPSFEEGSHFRNEDQEIRKRLRPGKLVCAKNKAPGHKSRRELSGSAPSWQTQSELPVMAGHADCPRNEP